MKKYVPKIISVPIILAVRSNNDISSKCSNNVLMGVI
jgi:hypothetical protein